MSYSIIYGRQFVKTTKGIIPMILSGSNNCTEFIQGREVLERNWYPMTLSNKDKRIAILRKSCWNERELSRPVTVRITNLRSRAENGCIARMCSSGLRAASEMP